MHPALNYRQSRRSACDRCRGFKLRCERDQVRGRPCERCLKAQVICTTSLSQPVFPSSKANAPTLPSEYDGSFSNYDRLPMLALHKPTLSGVHKSSFVPPRVLRTHFDPSSYLANGSILDDFAVSLQSSNSLSVPPDQWRNTNSSWDANQSGDTNLPWDFNFQAVSFL
jgi:hypothetical protein